MLKYRPMSSEIPLRICNTQSDVPILKEEVPLQGDLGVFELLGGAPINHGFQWSVANNLSYNQEPGAPSLVSKQAVRRKVVEFANQLGMQGEDTVLAHTVSRNLNIVDIEDPNLLIDCGEQGFFTQEAGAVFTTRPRLPIYTLMQDCTQTIFYGERKGKTPVVGLIHSGRYEAEQRFPYQAIMHATKKYGLNPRNIKLGMSPSLEPKHHRIRINDLHRVVSDLSVWLPYAIGSITEDVFYIDFRSFIAEQFIEAGVPASQIELHLSGLYNHPQSETAVSFRKATELQVPMISLGIAVEIQ